MTTTWIIIAILLVICWIIWCVAPVLPWPQLAYLGILVFHFMCGRPFSTLFLILWFIIIVAVIIIDNFLPVLATKKLGWSKYWTWWAGIWTVIWLFWWIRWIILGPFAWALIGEFIKRNSIKKSIKPALWSFIWIAMSWIIKIALCIILWGYIITEAIKIR